MNSDSVPLVSSAATSSPSAGGSPTSIPTPVAAGAEPADGAEGGAEPSGLAALGPGGADRDHEEFPAGVEAGVQPEPNTRSHRGRRNFRKTGPKLLRPGGRVAGRRERFSGRD